jgi:hypothetical protein
LTRWTGFLQKKAKNRRENDSKRPEPIAPVPHMQHFGKRLGQPVGSALTRIAF